MTDSLIPAATIILLRNKPVFETLMVERHADIAFAGGALVFPGGRIDEGDRDPRWASHCEGFDAAPAEQRAPRIAAIREAFEETGLLLARDANGEIEPEKAALLAPWRKRVENDDALFLEMVERHQLRLALDDLHLFARWRPPKGVGHRRYDTWFFAAPAPSEQAAEPDGGEATEVVWSSPAKALEARDRGTRKMIFPTSRNVELLNESGSMNEVFQFASKREIRPVEPMMVERDGQHFLTIPDDLGYPVTEEPLASAMRG